MPAPRRYPLAKMSVGLACLTAIVLPLPLVLTAFAVTTEPTLLLAPGALVLATYVFVFVWMRPTSFELSDAGLRIFWPLREDLIALRAIKSAETMSGRAFRERYGLGMRIGAGGLWGGFGLYKTRRATFRFYISRMDDYVVLQTTARPLLITPRDPGEFARHLNALLAP